MELESLAIVGVLVANAVFIVVSVASYLRMNSHELRRQKYIHHALKETRESGHELKAAAKSLMRLLDRLDRQEDWRKSAPMSHSPSGFDILDGHYGEDPDETRLQAPPDVHRMSHQAYDEWRRLQERELERVLMQRRRLLHDIHELQGRSDEAQRQAQHWRSKHDALSRERKQWQGAQRELDQARESLTQHKNMLEMADRRLEEVVQTSERLQAELAQLQRNQAHEPSSEEWQQRIRQLESTLHRQLVEKQFIEEHLLRLDASERQLRDSRAHARTAEALAA